MRKIFRSGDNFRTISTYIDSNFIDLANAFMRFAYPNYTLVDFADPDNEPDTPVENNCYIVKEDDTVWGLEVEKDNIIRRTSSAWVVLPKKLTEIQALADESDPLFSSWLAVTPPAYPNTIGTINHAASAKTTLVDADEITGQDSASSFSLIRTTWTNVKAFLKTYFDGLYALTGHNHTGTYEAANSNIQSHISSSSNPHTVTKTQVGLGNVTNDSQVKRSEMGAVSGVATLGTDGLVPSTQLPSSSGLALGETQTTAYRGDRGKTAYDHSQTTHDKTLVGLGNVDNTSDAGKPVSTAQATAIGLKVTANTAITGATKTKVTYDSKGLVTSGADATTADIADSTNKRYVTDANLTVIGNTSNSNSGDETIERVSNLVSGAPGNGGPFVDTDLFLGYSGSSIFRGAWSTIKSTLKTYFDTIYSLTGHNHSGTYEPAFSKNTAFNKNFGTAAGDTCQGNDARLSDVRTPSDSSVTPAKLGAAFATSSALSGTAVDWSDGIRFTKTISSNTTLTFSNLHVGCIFLEITGNYAITLPTGFTYAGGTRASSGVTLIQVICTETSGPVGWYVLLKAE